ncbi:MAG: hypothetical protein AVDCRST_MAG19-3327, partial [uncultured Thermomicrobiales bacterium]
GLRTPTPPRRCWWGGRCTRRLRS